MTESTTPCPRCKSPHGTHAPDCSYLRHYPPIEERFWSRVRKGGEGACWVWTGTQDGHGYGSICYQGRMQKAPRVVWMLTYGGSLPSKVLVCHHCDNPACVRPDHLFLGNHTTNAQDMASKGRQVFQRNPDRATRGEQHYCAKLTEDAVRDIRRLHEQGIKPAALARMYDTSIQTILRTVQRVTWKHVH